MTTQTEVKERPIIFGPDSIESILSGAKTQTRRVIKANIDEGMRLAHEDGGGNWIFWSGLVAPNMAEFTKRAYPNGEGVPCPYGKQRDRLWVRESWYCAGEHWCDGYPVRYEVDAELAAAVSTKWRTPIFMPRWASRITLEITNVRVERLQEITEAGAIAEGVDSVFLADLPRQATTSHRADFKQLWDKINAKRGYSWADNPFVWVLEFRKL